MGDTIKILYNYKYGAFIIPKELLDHLNITYHSDKSFIDFSDDIRLNHTLIDFIEKFKEHKKTRTDYKFLSGTLCRENGRLYQIHDHIDKMDVIEVPKIAYEYGALTYSEYDGKETIKINEDKMLLIKVKNLFKKLCDFGLPENIKNELEELEKEMPRSVCL